MEIFHSVFDFYFPKTRVPFVYFLLNSGEVVYVGQSKRLVSRIGTHVDDGKIFTKVACIECVDYTPSSVNELERFFIKLLHPKYNAHWKYSKFTKSELTAGAVLIKNEQAMNKVQGRFVGYMISEISSLVRSMVDSAYE